MAQASPRGDFLGHPRGLGFIISAESMSAFSFYGMQALLVLYMTQFLLLPEHISHIAGFTVFRGGLEALYGPLSPPALASAIQGVFAGGFFFTPIIGGFLADRVIGRTQTVVLGAVLMAAGHFLMAFDFSFLIALACLLAGAGCFGGNIATQLGELYGPADLRRPDAFQLFQLGVTVAVIFAPLICGTLGQNIAWHWGFAAAGLGMVLGLGAYLAGLRHMPQQSAHRALPIQRPKMTKAERKTVILLVALLPVFTITMIANQEVYNAYMIWGNATYDLKFYGQSMPVTWLISLDAFIGAAVTFPVILFWRWWERHFGGVDEITRLSIGAFIMAAAPLTLAGASAQMALTGHKAGLVWGLAFHLINSIGFSNLYPTGMALYSRAAPPAVAGLMMGVFKLHLVGTNLLVGYLGGLVSSMAGSRFWLLHTALIACGGGLFLLCRTLFSAYLAPQPVPLGHHPNHALANAG